MRNIALILFAAWLLFGNGLSAVQSWLTLPAVQAVPGTVATGLDRALTLPTAAVATPIAGVLQPQAPARAPIITAVATSLPAAAPAPAAGEILPPIIIVTATPLPPTPLPAPGAPAFKDSFEEPGCSQFIGYLPGDECYGHDDQASAPLPEPGEPGFAESFK